MSRPAWISVLKYNPVDPLTESRNRVLSFFAGKDLFSMKDRPVGEIMDDAELRKILKRQCTDGSWPAHGKDDNTGPKYSLIETWKNLRFLVDKYQMTKDHESIRNAAEYVFSCQTDEGDIRGILANQYAPYYTGAILYLLIRAGYQDDPRIDKGMAWLFGMRQDDGGWVIGSPGLLNVKWKEVCRLTSEWTAEPVRDFDRSRPFSAAGTGMVLRAFSVHPGYRQLPEALKAALLLKSKFFREDNWSWYRHPDNWLRFQFPFWWTNIVSALDTVSLIGIPKDDPDVKAALEWLIDNQQENGLWKASYSTIHKNSNDKKAEELSLWISLCICRILKRYFGEQ